MISVLAGIAAAVFVSIPQIAQTLFPQMPWNAPILILGVAGLAMVIQRFVVDTSSGNPDYKGLADVFVHIHAAGSMQSARKWALRGLNSLLLCLFGGTIGAEGAGTEFSHSVSMALQSRSSRWYELRRRTDAAVALAAGISAAFGAPFAALLIPLELGTGGAMLQTVFASVAAFLGVQVLSWVFHFPTFPFAALFANFQLSSIGSFQQFGLLLLIAIVCAALAIGTIRFIRYTEESLQELFQTKVWMRVLAGGILLFLVMVVNKHAHQPFTQLILEIFEKGIRGNPIALLFITQLLCLSLVVAGFGTVGVFAPLFFLGTLIGSYFSPEGASSFQMVAAFAGGAAFLGAVLGTPVMAAVLAFEMTRSPVVFLICLGVALAAHRLRKQFYKFSLMDIDLQARGVELSQGRSAGILNALLVKDAMVTDFDSIHENEPISELRNKLIKSRYPFLPVLNSQGAYLGMLTVDMIEDSWLNQEVLSKTSPLSKLFEAKDLLYRSGLKTPTIKVSERLSSTSEIFQETPCVPVIADDGRIMGLLFAHSVRLAYDREVARRSLAFQYGNRY
jgi:CIC family chloride channel protein